MVRSDDRAPDDRWTEPGGDDPGQWEHQPATVPVNGVHDPEEAAALLRHLCSSDWYSIMQFKHCLLELADDLNDMDGGR